MATQKPPPQFSDFPPAVRNQLIQLVQRLQLVELLVLQRLHLGLDWKGEVFNDPQVLEQLLEWGLIVKSEPQGQVYLTARGSCLAEMVAVVWPKKPRPGAAAPLPTAKPRPQLRLVDKNSP